jgi:type II secretory pathway pseudopilin PulG
MLAKTFLYPDRERGVGLVEAMVSIAILAIITLGIGLVMSSSYHTITATEVDVNQQQLGMGIEALGTPLPTTQTYSTSTDSMSIIVPGGGGNPLVTVASSTFLIPTNNLLTLSIGAGTGVTSSTESVQYGVISSVSNQNKWWIP